MVRFYLQHLPQMYIYETIFTQKKKINSVLKMKIIRHNLSYEIFGSETKW